MAILKEIKLLLLNFFKKNKDIQTLKQLGYTHSEIQDIIDKLILEGLLIQKEDKVILTEKGYEELELSNKKGVAYWIQLENKSKIDKIDKNSVFLPNRNNLFFDVY